MDNRRRWGGRARIIAIVLALVAGAGACGDDTGGPPTSPAGTSADSGRGAGSATPGVTSPPGSGPAGTTVRAVPTGLADGWNVVAPAPERYTNDNDALLHDFGQGVSMAFGAGSTPVVGWASLTDPANNGYTISTSELVVNDGWAPPVEVARARLAPGPSAHLFSMAGNVQSGVVAIAFERHDDSGSSTGIELMLSTDRGRRWTRAVPVEGESYRPAVAVSASAVFVAYAGADGYAISTASLPPPSAGDPAAPIDGGRLSWSVQALPGIEGYVAMDRQPSVAVDRSGRAAVAVLVASATGARRAVAFVDVAERAATKAIEVDAVAPGSASVALAYRDDDPVVAVAFEPRPDPNVLAYVVSSTDRGSTFAAPSSVPTDLSERAPFGVGLSVLQPRTGVASTGPATTVGAGGADEARAVLIYEPDTIGLSTTRCGLPRLVWSADLSRWTTCGAGTATGSTATAVQPANLVPVAVAGPDGHLYVPVTNRNPAGPVPLGIVLWRGP